MRKSASSFLPGIFSIGAGFVHAIAAGTHTEHRATAVSMLVLAAAQIGLGIAALASASPWWRTSLVLVNAGAVVGWILTRTSGISFINGLETSEKIQAADALCAALGAFSILAVIGGHRLNKDWIHPFAVTALTAAIAAPAALATTNHVHAHGTDDHSHVSTTANWPRPFFAGAPIDIAGVDGVTAAQESRATNLIKDTEANLVHWADYKVAEAEGWRSIGDQATGYEHFVKFAAMDDGKFLDATAPESIVYKVYGDTRILVSAMYMAEGAPALDDPLLTDYAGPLFQWHVHQDLCWSMKEGRMGVVGVLDANGNCPPGSFLNAVMKPMVHVWIVSHPCGPFAAVEGIAEGQAQVDPSQRVDVCSSHTH